MVSSTFLPFLSISLLLLSNGIFAAPFIDDGEQPQEKIIGGQTVPNPTAYAWEVSLGRMDNVPADPQQRRNQPAAVKLNAHICGGVLLNDRVVLTAAHCVVDYLTNDDPVRPSTRIGVGVYSTQGKSGRDLVDIYNQGRIPVADIKIKKGYHSNNAASPDDIALLLLSQPVDLGRHPAACLLQQNLPPGGMYLSIGWGTNSPVIKDQLTGQVSGYHAAQQLQQANVKDVSSSAPWCYGRYDLICLVGAQSPGPCSGDSGGSLVLDNQWVVGLTSFGPSYTSKYKEHLCNGRVAYTRLSIHINWIQSIIGSNFCVR